MSLVSKTYIICLHSQKRIRVKTYAGKKYSGNAFIIKKLQEKYLEKMLRYHSFREFIICSPGFQNSKCHLITRVAHKKTDETKTKSLSTSDEE